MDGVKRGNVVTREIESFSCAAKRICVNIISCVSVTSLLLP